MQGENIIRRPKLISDGFRRSLIGWSFLSDPLIRYPIMIPMTRINSIIGGGPLMEGRRTLEWISVVNFIIHPNTTFT